MPGKPSLLVRVTWALVWMCLRMLIMVVRPILRLPRRLRWLQVVLVVLFVIVFFHRPALAYYWFWGAALLEITLLILPVVLAERGRIRSWLRR